MFTVCPKCALTLVVTAADLRVAQGYVRCGRCSSVFNALARLADERQAAGGEALPAAAPEPATPRQEAPGDLSPLEEALGRPEEVAPLPETAEEPISENALEFDPESTDVGAVFVQPPPNPQWTAATGSFKAMVAAGQQPPRDATPAAPPGESRVDVEMDADFLAEMLREPAPQERVDQPTELERAPPPPRSPPSAAEPREETSRDSVREHGVAAPSAATRRAAAPGITPRPVARHASPHVRPPAEASAKPRPAEVREPAQPAPEAREAPPPDEPVRPARVLDAEQMIATDNAVNRAMPVPRLHPQVYTAGAVLGLLVLLAQIVNHYRDELAATSRFNRPLTALYSALGVQLTPHWDLRAYDVRQLGAAADPGGSGLITVRASIKNAGQLPQPLPLLRVTLQDRFGNRIAARDVPPRYYVPHSMPDSSYLAGGQRIDAEMGFLDPGANAVGFEIDACLPTSGGAITCANDLVTR